MSHRYLAPLAMGFAFALVCVPQVPVAGQEAPSAAKPKAAKPAKTWTAPKTSWGHPNLQGTWTNGTTTPLERPNDSGGKEFLSDEEVSARNEELRTRADKRLDNSTADVELAYNAAWWDRGKVLKRTSLITDPPDGRLPALTPEGTKRRAQQADARRGRGAYDSWVDRPLQERCLLYHGVPPMPTGYNNNYQIAQTPDYVAIRYEMLAETRIIPLDDRPHLSSNIRQWIGDARGHWEGQTLVVETTNYSEKTTFRFPAINEKLRIVERFTRVDADNIDYQFTVYDPSYTKPWTAMLPLSTADGLIFEYACHEGNYGLPHVLSGARAQEAETAKKGSK